MPVYIRDNGYFREIEGGGENLPTQPQENGSIIYQYRHIFTGPTLLEQPTGNPVETWDFAGLTFATPSGAPYDKVARIIESANNAGGAPIYTSRPVDMSYQLADGSVYYHQHYGYAGPGQGYISTETVDGSYFDTFFYKARFDNYDAGGRLTSQYYQDGNGTALMLSDYAYNPAIGPWTRVESDALPNGQGQMDLAHQIYTEADGSVYADVVYRTVNGFANLYTTGSGVTDGGYAARIDQYGFPNHIVQQQFFDSGNSVDLTIDYAYGGFRGLAIATTTSYGAALDDDPYQRIVDHYNQYGPGVTKRVYDMRDGSHTVEVLMAQQWLMGTSLAPGVVNADDTYALFGQDLVYFEGRFGTDILYNFLYATSGSLGARLHFESSQFADLAAVRAAATSSGDGTDITITNSFGDEVVLKSVLQPGTTIDDVLNSSSVIFSGTTGSAMAQVPEAESSSKGLAGDSAASAFAVSADTDFLAVSLLSAGQFGHDHGSDYWA